MFDCGNSRGRVAKREKRCSSAVSVTTCDSNEYSNQRYRHPSSRRFTDQDLLYSLIEDLRYSGRIGHTDDRYRRYEKAYDVRKPSRAKCIKEEPSLTFDGGTSISQYAKGPSIDLGSSEEQPTPSPNSYGGACLNNAAYYGHSGADIDCDDKIVFDGGTA